MATPADQRLMELLDKWLSSLDLHIKYSSLDDETYWKMQPWVEHQRPNRWIIDLARQKTLALKKEVQKRIDAADAGFSDTLELMAFLANLVGSQHIERFIPIADPDAERWVSNASSKMAASDETREMPRSAPAATASPTGTMEMLAPEKPSTAATATREMPRFVVPRAQTPPPVTTEQITRIERKGTVPTPPTLSTPVSPEDESRPAAAPPATKPASKPAAKSAPKSGARGAGKGSGAELPPAVTADIAESVIADAVRLMQWGRKWYELAELISRMADRPALPDVRRILKDRKSEIEKLAGR